ncbi:MAG: class I SAM-dependent methyltransferase [Nocardioides sp.]|nr:class I SAM-dependent methyltransferase [Thermoleophilia bacterium]MCB8955839.1 class I SAM-dependent methyltransferase [Nocardioides sp.]
MSRDWHAWHEKYDDPTSSLSRRLAVVRSELGSLLAAADAPVRLVSLCAGDGRDTLPVLADAQAEVDAVLVELDPGLAEQARATADALGLDRVEVRTADAGTTDTFADACPADVLLACGVFGNVRDDGVAATVAALPSLLTHGAHVVWTRGRQVPHDPTEVDGDPSLVVRDLFAATGFEQVSFVRPDDAGFRVGVHRWPGATGTPRPGHRLFSFV